MLQFDQRGQDRAAPAHAGLSVLRTPATVNLSGGMRERLSGLRGNVERLIERERRALQMGAYRLAVNEFSREKMDFAFYAKFVNRQDVRMIQGRGGQGLLLKAAQAVFVQRERFRQHLERDLPIAGEEFFSCHEHVGARNPPYLMRAMNTNQRATAVKFARTGFNTRRLKMTMTEKGKTMKRILKMARRTLVGLALAGLILFPGFPANTLAAPKGVPTNTLHFRNTEKKVDITVEIHGKIDGYTAQSIEAVVEPWLEAAHVAVVNADGVDILELHIRIDVDDDDDDDDGVKDAADNDDDGNGDGKGWHITSGCSEWHEDRDADTLDAINDILHEMIEDFIDKFVH